MTDAFQTNFGIITFNNKCSSQDSGNFERGFGLNARLSETGIEHAVIDEKVTLFYQSMISWSLSWNQKLWNFQFERNLESQVRDVPARENRLSETWCDSLNGTPRLTRYLPIINNCQLGDAFDPQASINMRPTCLIHDIMIPWNS